MNRLVVGDLVANLRVWAGASLVVVAVAMSTAFAVTVAQTGLGITDLDPHELVVLSGIGDIPADQEESVAQVFVAAFVVTAVFVVLFVAAIATAVLGSTIRLTVSLQRRSYALWQIVGVMPGTAVRIVRSQVLVVGTIAACIGTGLGALVVVPMLDWGLGVIDELPHVPVHFTAVGALITVVAVVLITWLGVLRPSRAVGQVDALEALRGPATTRVRMTVVRWIIAAVLAVMAAQTLWTLRGTKLDQAGSVGMSAVFLLVLTIVAVSPIVVPWLTRTWTRVIPDSASSSWYLARKTAEYDLGRSSSTVLSIMLAIAVPGGIWAAITTIGSASGSAGSADSGIGGFALILVGPLVIALAGATASVFMSSGARDRELALVRSAGGAEPVVVRTALWEALIHVGTATILAAAVIVVIGVSSWIALIADHPGARPDFGVTLAAPVAGVAAVLLAVATLLPTLHSLRQRLVTQLMES